MGKNALYYISPEMMGDPLPFKKLSLLFDKIYIRDRILPSEVLKYNKDEYFDSHGSFWQKAFLNLKEVEYLIEQDIIATYDGGYTLGENEIEKKGVTNIFKYASPEFRKAEKKGFPEPGTFLLTDKIYLEATSMAARMDALMLSVRQNVECFPIVSYTDLNSQKDKKENVFQFLLNEIPEPSDSVSWEQLIDFRSDDGTRLKYLALINWINEVARSNYSLNEIKDKYEYLYLDYKKSYERHKMKSSLTTLEVIVSAGAALATNNIPIALNIASQFFKISSSVMELFNNEASLPGKEIAYVYHANQEFS